MLRYQIYLPLTNLYIPLTNSISHSVFGKTFLDELKQLEVVPLNKNLALSQKKNCSAACLLLHVSNVFEKII